MHHSSICSSSFLSLAPLLCLMIAAFGGLHQATAAAELDDANLLVLQLAGLSPPELPAQYGDENPFGSASKRTTGTMRNALIRFGRSPRSPRSSATMRNALVRFGKRSGPAAAAPTFDEDQQSSSKRNSAPQPFVRFGRSPQRRLPAASMPLMDLGDGGGAQWAPPMSSPFAFAFL